MADPLPTTQDQPARRDVALVIPSLGAASLDRCLDATGRLDPAPRRIVVALSGKPLQASRRGVEVVHSQRPLGFAAAINMGIARAGDGCDRLAILNDDAVPPPHWLAVLGEALDADVRLAAVQSTITDREGRLVDGRGITLDRWRLPVQADRGDPIGPERRGELRPTLAVSGTAALLRRTALSEATSGRMAPFDPAFGSYHEDLDLGLRLRRLGWRAAWVADAPTRHLGSTTGRRLQWRHPWWLLANRWRVLSGNLVPTALILLFPRLLRGELRAFRSLVRINPRAAPVSLAVLGSLPVLVTGGWCRRTAGPRLSALPGVP